MKAILFILANFYAFSFGFGQTYHSFIHDSAIWSEWETSSCCDPQYGAYQSFKVNYIMEGDTIIGNLTYKKISLQITDCIYGGVCLPCWGIVTPPAMIGFIREDSSKKVFYLSHLLNQPPVQCVEETFETEKILYDFGLNTGDTVQWKPFNKVVVKIDSLQAANGEYLRRMWFDNQQDYWVEGLGSAIAFFGSYMPPPFECGCTLFCAEAIDLLPSNAQPPCGGIVNAIHDLHGERKLKISPNPFSDFLTVTSPFQSPSVLSVMNSQGQIIFKRSLQPLAKISFSMDELQDEDFLFFRLTSDERESETGIALHIF